MGGTKLTQLVSQDQKQAAQIFVEFGQTLGANLQA
jgi:hypothetical protein